MVRELLFKSQLRQAVDDLDPRTLIKRFGVQPIGTIKIGNREFEVFDKAWIEQIKAQRAAEEAGK